MADALNADPVTLKRREECLPGCCGLELLMHHERLEPESERNHAMDESGHGVRAVEDRVSLTYQSRDKDVESEAALVEEAQP